MMKIIVSSGPLSLPCPLVELLANPLSQQAGKRQVIPEGEGDNDSLCE